MKIFDLTEASGKDDMAAIIMMLKTLDLTPRATTCRLLEALEPK